MFCELFRKCHTAASAHPWHDTKLYLDGGEDQTLLADRTTNPPKSDISRLYTEWQKKELRDDNKKEMCDKLQAEIDAYNDACSKQEGKANIEEFQGYKILSPIIVVMRVTDPPPKKVV